MTVQPTIRNELSTPRILAFIGVVAVVFAVFILRLFVLQVLQGNEWLAKAAENSTQEINIAAQRGLIYDRNGVILARNVASYNVVVKAADLPDDPGATQEIFRQLSALIGVPVNRNEISPENPYVPCVSDHGIAQIAEYAETSTPYQPVRIVCDIDERVAKVIREKKLDWPGIDVEIQPIREYPTGSVTASMIGFLGPVPAALEDYYVERGLVPNRDKVGYAGLELQYQDLLAGRNGLRVVQVDVAGQELRNIAPPIPPRPGNSIRLTIDTRLQQAALEILVDEINDWNAYFNEMRYSSGVVIAMNPKTGEILAMVSYPTYENNRMARFIPAYYYNQLVNDPTNPLLNHAVGDVLPAGSVFKLVTSVGALNEGVVTPDQVISTPPKLEVTERYYANDPGQAREFVDWNKAGFGHQDFVHGLANSSNVYFYKLGGGYKDEVPNGGLGICRLGTYARALGYGQAPGIGLPDEEDGLVPDPTWKRINQAESWSSGDTYIASVGQGYVLATPIQVLLSAATIANDGKLMQPTLLREVLDNEGNVIPIWRTPEGDLVEQPTPGSVQVSPFQPIAKWDLTTDPVIQEYGETTIRGCEPIPGKMKTVAPWVFQKIKEGMRLAVTEGTLAKIFAGETISAAGKTGTAEYCDKYANALNRCIPGNWPSHAWTVAFAPLENPEIAVVAYVYNGTEGSTVAGPIVRRVLETYFELKNIDTAPPVQ
ncbi:MAG: penicillin-binding protein 2 [Anaerolineales bacterium]|jgi:penicillin-binding protein 2|nr:penicillin-binding protein 2 [Anaerolineales bacterium]